MTPLSPKTPNTFTHKLASLQSRAWLPPALLLLALSSVFIFGGDRGHFYRDKVHNENSAKFLAIADNLSAEHRFLMFLRHYLNPGDGKTRYKPYNRFPIGGFALTKLAILPFKDDPSAQIYAARMLMLLFFAAAAVLAYISLCRITSSRWIALTATLLAFSSIYCLYYSDLISNEATMDLFALMLVFHAIVIFEQTGRFRQLLLKTCIALLLGWHVYALLLPFIAFGLIRKLIKTLPNVSTLPISALCQLKRTTLSLTRSRYLTLGAVALLFGVSVLTFNFTSEYFALNRETPLTKLPSFQSMIYRTGVDSHLRDPGDYDAKYLHWPNFLESQLQRIGMMALPYAFFPPFVEYPTDAPSRLFAVLGIVASGASLIGLLFVRRHKILLASLTLSGFCWALPMRYNVALPLHDFESVFYIGIALTLFSLALLWLHRLLSERLIAALSVVALLIFALSALRMSQLNNANQDLAIHQSTFADMRLIREMIKGKSTEVTSNLNWNTMLYYYYLRGRTIIPGYTNPSDKYKGDFVLSFTRIDVPALLTPHNRGVYLYDAGAYIKQSHEIIEQAGAPLIRSHFDVYLNGQNLIYFKDTCGNDDTNAPFFLAAYPVNKSDLPVGSRQRGFQNLDFHFEDQLVHSGDRCIAIAPLPDYDIARIYTGQYIQRTDGSTQHLWEGELFPADRLINDRLKRIDEIIEQAGAPLIRSNFDVYISDDTLIYVKDGCSENDTDAPFFLAAFPVNENDLPVGFRQHGFQNLDFGFRKNGIRQGGGRCIAIAQLPDYDIARISTGQYIRRADGSFEHLWEGGARLTEVSH